MDNDTGSIGGIKNPPPATRKLYYASIIFDALGLLLCLAAGWQILLLVAGYVTFSKAYSWHGIRLKRYSYLAWLSVAAFQGGYTFLMANMAAEGQYSTNWFTAGHLEAMLIASILLGGSYPLTQIYQHKEDAASGDRTLSLRLGIKGTFVFSGLSFFLGALLFLHYFSKYYSSLHFVVFLLCLSPVIIYFTSWFLKANKDKNEASFERTMRMNQVSSICMAGCFTILLYINLPYINVIWPGQFSR